MPEPSPIPYRLACLCDLRDEQGRVLLLRRAREPNRGLCSPIGGKLDTAVGESPARCAQREIREEAGLDIPLERLHLMGLISEESPPDRTGGGHWLLFYFRVLGPVAVQPGPIDEGLLEWHRPEDLADEQAGPPIPETDRRVIWPLAAAVEARGPTERHGFFSVHLDLTDGTLKWRVDQVLPPTPRPR